MLIRSLIRRIYLLIGESVKILRLFSIKKTINIQAGCDKKIIACSLFGVHEKYTLGAIEVAKTAKDFYAGWITRFYISKNTPAGIISQLADLGAEVIVMAGNISDLRNTFWRFLPASEENVSVMISRDTDSRFSKREIDAVNEWLNSDKKFHIMRDHPNHDARILGGMWGVKRGAIVNIKKKMTAFDKKNRYGSDQEFLENVIYPLIKNDAYIHDSFKFYYDEICRPFPGKRVNNEYVGERIGGTPEEKTSF